MSNVTATSTPPIATAIPVTVSPIEYQQQSPQATMVQSVPPQHAEPAPICRGCGREFVRAPGVHDAQSSYYRCDDCNRTTIWNFCIIQWCQVTLFLLRLTILNDGLLMSIQIDTLHICFLNISYSKMDDSALAVIICWLLLKFFWLHVMYVVVQNVITLLLSNDLWIFLNLLDVFFSTLLLKH